MTLTIDAAKHAVANNDPEIEQGQVWSARKKAPYSHYHDKIRVICRYPFDNGEKMRIWIVEPADKPLVVIRIPELTLRMIYELKP